MRADYAYAAFEAERDAEGLGVANTQAFNVPLERIGFWWDKAGHENLRVLRRGDATVAGLVLVPMAQYFGGRALPMAGIAGVAVAPEARGQGAASCLMAETLRELHRRGFALSALYASTVALYRAVGYEPAGTNLLAVAPYPAFPRVRGAGGVRPVGEADWDVLFEAHPRFARLHDGHVERGPYLWERIQSPRDANARAFLIDGPGGSGGSGGPDGFVVLHMPTAGGAGPARLTLRDWGAATPAAFRAVLGLLSAHATMWKELAWTTGATDAILATLPEYRSSLTEREPWLLRIVDARRALEGRGYPPGASGALHLELRDDVVAENEGRLVLRVEGGHGRVEPGGEGRVRLDVRALAPAFTGYQRAEDLALLGHVEGPAEDLALASSLFRTGTPTMPDFF